MCLFSKGTATGGGYAADFPCRIAVWKICSNYSNSNLYEYYICSMSIYVVDKLWGFKVQNTILLQELCGYGPTVQPLDVNGVMPKSSGK